MEWPVSRHNPYPLSPHTNAGFCMKSSFPSAFIESHPLLSSTCSAREYVALCSSIPSQGRPHGASEPVLTLDSARIEGLKAGICTVWCTRCVHRQRRHLAILIAFGFAHTDSVSPGQQLTSLGLPFCSTSSPGEKLLCSWG